jgi:hypothetical protein
MRQTLRRSCAACAKSKSKCDLRMPRCSRCIKRNIQCTYANEPLTATLVVAEHQHRQLTMPLRTSEICDFGSVDPFDSYPPTRLPREHAQRLIHTCMIHLCEIYRPDAANQPSPYQDCFPILSLGSGFDLESILGFLVANCARGSSIVPRLATNSMPRRGAVGSKRLPNL